METLSWQADTKAIDIVPMSLGLALEPWHRSGTKAVALRKGRDFSPDAPARFSHWGGLARLCASHSSIHRSLMALLQYGPSSLQQHILRFEVHSGAWKQEVASNRHPASPWAASER